MKNIKSFLKFTESAIMPTYSANTKSLINNSKQYTISELNDIFNTDESDGVRFMLRDEFIDSLKTKEEKDGVPNRSMTPNMYFGVFLADKDLLVICLKKNKVIFDNSEISLIDEILRHESIHREQSKRSNGKAYILGDPNNKKEYLSHYSELMAFARSYVDQCKSKDMSKDDILNAMRKGRHSSWIPYEMKDNIDIKDLNRFWKYVYEYINADEELNKKE